MLCAGEIARVPANATYKAEVLQRSGKTELSELDNTNPTASDLTNGGQDGQMSVTTITKQFSQIQIKLQDVKVIKKFHLSNQY